MVNSKHAFWQALIFTIIIFGIGLLIGYYIENIRTSKTELAILNSEINLLDQQVRSRAINEFEIECQNAKKNTFEFADSVYMQAQTLERYDSTNKFIETLKILHKRYDLLRVLLWMQAIELKERCGKDFHTIVYIYEYNPQELETRAEQAAISRLLLDFKEKHGEKILLIPIAGNLELESINLIKDKYNIKKLPAIIVDEKIVIRELPNLEELERIIFK